MSNISYTAESLEEIATEFRRRADRIRKSRTSHSLSAVSLSKDLARAETWDAAAAFLSQTAMVPKDYVKLAAEASS